jgi:PAS domain S-box-containing protein
MRVRTWLDKHWTTFALALLALIAVADLFVFPLRPFYTLVLAPPLIAAARSPVRSTLWVGLLALLAATVVSLMDATILPHAFVIRSVTVAGGVLLATFIAVVMRGSERAMAEAEARYRALAEGTDAGVWHVDAGGRTLYINPALCRILEIEELEAPGGVQATLSTPPGLEALRALYLEQSGPGPSAFPAELPGRRGTRRDVLVTGAQVAGTDGRPSSLVFTILDVTDRQRVERIQSATYRISEAVHTAPSLQGLFGAIHGIVGELMPAANFYIALYDTATDTISFPYFVDESDPPPAPKRPGKGLTEYVLRTGKPVLVTPDIQEALERSGEADLVGAPSLDWVGVPLTTRDGRTIGVLVVQSYTEGVRYRQDALEILQFVSTQIAMAIEHKQAEEALRDSEERYRQLVELAPDAIIVHLDGIIGFANSAAVQLYGARTSADLVGKPVLDLVHPDFRALVTARVRAVQEAGERAPLVDQKHVRLDGSVMDVEVQANRLTYGGRQAIQALVRDVGERRRAEERMRTQAEALDAAANAIIITDRDLRIEWVNRAFTEFTQYELAEIVGQEPRFLRAETVDADTFDEMRAVLMTGDSWRRQVVNRRKDGSEFMVDVAFTPVKNERGEIIRFVGVGQDVSERRRLEDQLRQSQKLEAIGQLAGGVAHDFNNLLTTVLASAALLGEQLPRESPHRQDIEAILDAAQHGSELTRKLLAFSRRQRLEMRLAVLGDLVQDFARMVRRIVPEDVELSVRTSSSQTTVRADPGAVEQILMNLVTNARDAMPGGGTIRVEVGRGTISEAHQRLHGWGTPGDYVLMTVSDTGSGMDAETQRRIFEPFFTTKPVGSGTGLGMAMVYGLVKEHNGFVYVESAPGRGTVVSLYFPHATGQTGEYRAVTKQEKRGGKETILLVEDNEAVRQVAKRVLERFGYTVLAAADGREALKLIGSTAEPDLIISDIVMPHVSGPQLISALRERGLKSKLLFTSGYAAPEVRERMAQEPDVPFLAKPWTVPGLLQRVREVLDA